MEGSANNLSINSKYLLYTNYSTISALKVKVIGILNYSKAQEVPYSIKNLAINEKVVDTTNNDTEEYLKNQLYYLCIYTDANGNACYNANKTSLASGEKYLIIPSYSPENYEKTTSFALCVNAAMDISAANYALKMAIDVENLSKTSGYQERIASYENLINNLPEYTYDETGAIKEWCANGFEDDNSHRHISHLYCAWPAFELDDNEELAAAVKQALVNRDEDAVLSEATQSHGWLHRGLVYARLGDSEGVDYCLYQLLHSQLQYTSFMTDHNTNRKSRAYCTDSAFGLIGIIDEMLLYSTQETIEVLPACPSTLSQGSFTNLRARCRANVSCTWNNNKASVTIKSDIAQTIKVKYGSTTKEVKFNAGETKSINF